MFFTLYVSTRLDIIQCLALSFAKPKKVFPILGRGIKNKGLQGSNVFLEEVLELFSQGATTFLARTSRPLARAKFTVGSLPFFYSLIIPRSAGRAVRLQWTFANGCKLEADYMWVVAAAVPGVHSGCMGMLPISWLLGRGCLRPKYPAPTG